MPWASASDISARFISMKSAWYWAEARKPLPSVSFDHSSVRLARSYSISQVVMYCLMSWTSCG